MKKAKLFIAAIEITCPHCDETQESESGSFLWDPNYVDFGTTMECLLCGKPFTLPATFRFALAQRQRKAQSIRESINENPWGWKATHDED